MDINWDIIGQNWTFRIEDFGFRKGSFPTESQPAWRNFGLRSLALHLSEMAAFCSGVAKIPRKANT